MSLYPNFETSTLVDLLAEHTERLTQLFNSGNLGKEYELCKKLIHELQSEIEFRIKSAQNNLPGNKSISNIKLKS
jgi:hypothetical protein